jgi:hypothetical protein
MIRKLLCLACVAALGPAAHSWCQSIERWDPIAAPAPDQDSCRFISNLEQLKAYLAVLGWPGNSPLPPINWANKIVVVTSADQSLRPNGSNSSTDGSKLLIRLDDAPQPNSGVFLLSIVGQPGSIRSCLASTFPPPSPPAVVDNTNVQESTTSKSTTKAPIK